MSIRQSLDHLISENSWDEVLKELQSLTYKEYKKGGAGSNIFCNLYEQIHRARWALINLEYSEQDDRKIELRNNEFEML